MSREADRPVFLFTQHRSGGTLLARALNCHPGLLIWGEHGGVVNHLAALDATVRALGPLMERPQYRGARGRALLKEEAAGSFDPWAHPFDHAAWRGLCRLMLRGTFAHHATPAQRWGFKEIRYHRPETAGLLQQLFPGAQFVLLRREIRALCRSNLLVDWSLDLLSADGTTESPASARQAVADCLFTLLAMRAGFDEIEARFAPDVLPVAYETLDQAETIAGVFRFLGLPVRPGVMEAVRATLARRLGETPPQGAGCITRPFVDATIDEMLPSVAAEVAATDPADLPAKILARRYAFLAGDHGLRGSGYTSLL